MPWRRKWQAASVLLSGKILWTRGAGQTTVYTWDCKEIDMISDWTIIILHYGYWLMCLFPTLDIRPLCRSELSLKYLLTPVHSMKLGSIANFQKYFLSELNISRFFFLTNLLTLISQSMLIIIKVSETCNGVVMSSCGLIELCYCKHTFFIHSHEDSAEAIKKYKMHEISNYGY